MDDFAVLDQLFANKDGNSFAIGDESNKILNCWLEIDHASQEEKVPLRTVLTHLLDELAGHDLDGIPKPGRYARYYSSVDSARDRIASYIRVTRFFDADRRAEIPQSMTFSVLSACLVGGEWPYPDEGKTMERLSWALENQANVTQIYDKFLGRDGETAEVKLLRGLKRACERYLDAVEKTNPASELAKRVRELWRLIQIASSAPREQEPLLP